MEVSRRFQLYRKDHESQRNNYLTYLVPVFGPEKKTMELKDESQCKDVMCSAPECERLWFYRGQ